MSSAQTPHSNLPTDPPPSGPAADWSQVFRSLALFAGIGASLVMYGQQVFRTNWVDAFLLQNQLDPRDRKVLLISIAIGAIVGAFIPSVVLLWKRSHAAVCGVRRVSHILSPLVLVCLAPAIFRFAPWKSDPMRLAATLGITILVLERTVSASLEAMPDRFWGWMRRARDWVVRKLPRVTRALPLIAVILGSIAFAVVVSFFCIRHHHKLGTAAYDLGIFNNLFYVALNGHPFSCYTQVPGPNWSSLQAHAELSIFFFLPFYSIAPRAETILILQATAVAAGALPVFLLARRRVSQLTAMLIAGAYLLYAPAHSGIFYDFHFQPVATPFLLWAFYLLDTRRNLAFAVIFVIALGCREDISVSLAIAGAIMMFTGYRPLAGLVVALISGAYFVAIKFVVMPHFGSWWFHDMYKGLFPPGDPTFGGVIKTLLTNPVFVLGTLLTEAKILHVARIMLPLAFLPLRRPWIWVGFLPAALFTILTTGYGPTTDTTFQYVFYWVPFIFTAAPIVLKSIREKQGIWKERAAIATMVVATLATSYNWGVLMQRNTFVAAWGPIDLKPMTEEEKVRLKDLRELAAMVPRGASLSASENECPHVSSRLVAYALRVCHCDADYILYRVGSGGFGGDHANQALSSGKYAKIAERSGLALLKKIR
ncbi:MAG: DUF2079 domain-containing protein [Deltaproteobacteria bacterium]|nr:DUF2079 domain-containing protein [Deltaproteobacteria bacterium]